MTAAIELADRGFTPVAWVPPLEDMEFDEWAALGLTLQQIDASLPWWIGDWLNYGEWAWGEEYAQAVDITGMDVGRLNNYKWVANKVDKHMRRESLSWSHHRIVAKFEPDVQKEWLDKAEDNEWTGTELQREIYQQKPVEIEPGDISQNGHHEDDIDIVAESHLIASPARRLRYSLKMLLDRHLHVAPYDVDHTVVIQAQNTFQETQHAENEDLDDE